MNPSTMPRSTRHSSPARRSAPTFWSTWVMAIPPASSRVRRASASTKPARSS